MKKELVRFLLLPHLTSPLMDFNQEQEGERERGKKGEKQVNRIGGKKVIGLEGRRKKRVGKKKNVGEEGKEKERMGSLTTDNCLYHIFDDDVSLVMFPSLSFPLFSLSLSLSFLLLFFSLSPPPSFFFFLSFKILVAYS